MKLSQAVLNRRVFNEDVLQKHIKYFMLGQTKPFLSRDKVTIDIGAAVGMYSSYFAKLSKQVIAFEAVQPIFKQLRKTSDKYDNIYPINSAVSHVTGQIDFYIDDKRLSNNSIYNLVDGKKTSVPSMTLDDFMLHHSAMVIKGEIGFIKIDVEGAELNVITGGMNVIGSHKPNMMVEIYPKFLPEGHMEIIFSRLLNYFDYKAWYNHRGQGLVEVTSVQHGVDVASDPKLLPIHDGDFLFTHE